jgi:hypothetical protein
MTTTQTPTDSDALLCLVERIKENYRESPPPPPPKRGQKREFSALSFLLLAAVAMTLRTFGNTELRKFLEKDERLRQAMGFERVPDRTCIWRRLSGLAPEAEQQIALPGRQIVDEVRPEEEQPEVRAIDGRMYKAQGQKLHKSDRQKDVVPWACATSTSNPNGPKAVIADGSKATGWRRKGWPFQNLSRFLPPGVRTTRTKLTLPSRLCWLATSK